MKNINLNRKAGLINLIIIIIIGVVILHFTPYDPKTLWVDYFVPIIKFLWEVFFKIVTFIIEIVEKVVSIVLPKK